MWLIVLKYAALHLLLPSSYVRGQNGSRLDLNKVE